MTFDLQLTLLSSVLLMTAIVWPMAADRRRRQRFARTGQVAARTVPYTGPAVLVAAGLGLLVTAGLL